MKALFILLIGGFFGFINGFILASMMIVGKSKDNDLGGKYERKNKNNI